MKYNITCARSEKTNVKNIGYRAVRPIEIPYLQYFEIADAYLKGPDSISVQRTKTENEETDFFKIFEFQTETVDAQYVWQIYAESFDFDQCIVRYAIWDKNHDRIAYLNENNQILRDIRQCGYDEHSLERKFCITLREEVILCNKTPRLNDLWNKLNEELETITVFEMQSPDEYVEKTIFVRNKNDCNFSFLWHYPLTVQPWEKSIENLIGELKCMRNKQEYLDADIFLNYSSNSYSLLEMKDGAL